MQKAQENSLLLNQTYKRRLFYNNIQAVQLGPYPSVLLSAPAFFFFLIYMRNHGIKNRRAQVTFACVATQALIARCKGHTSNTLLTGRQAFKRNLFHSSPSCPPWNCQLGAGGMIREPGGLEVKPQQGTRLCRLGRTSSESPSSSGAALNLQERGWIREEIHGSQLRVLFNNSSAH